MLIVPDFQTSRSSVMVNIAPLKVKKELKTYSAKMLISSSAGQGKK